MKSNRAKSTSIPKSVKEKVYQRQNGVSVVSGMAIDVSQCCCHIVSRSKGGLGIEQNIVGLTYDEHRILDRQMVGWNDKLEEIRKIYLRRIQKHMMRCYDGWSIENLTIGNMSRVHQENE